MCIAFLIYSSNMVFISTAVLRFWIQSFLHAGSFLFF